MKSRNKVIEQLGTGFNGGVAIKNLNLKKSILSYFGNEGHTSIAELAKTLNISTPKITELVNELVENDLVKDYGKGNSDIGRKPNLYGLNPDSIFFIGVDVKEFHINIGLLDFNKTLVKIKERTPFKLQNTAKSLEDLCKIIQQFLRGNSSVKDRVIGIGINLSGRINSTTGYSFSFFDFNKEPLSTYIEKKIGIKVYIENDSRAMAYGELCNGVVHEEKNVLYINMDYGIGMGIIVNGQLYAGKSGFAGEFGHIHVFDNEIICHCGKKGCLETEASGRALVKLFLERTKQGASTSLLPKINKDAAIELQDIIDAALDDDTLAIECIAVIGEKLGKGIATLINLFNPELVVLGGVISATGDYIRLPVKSAINKYSLSLVNKDTELKISSLFERAGIVGACLLVRDRLLSTEL